MDGSATRTAVAPDAPPIAALKDSAVTLPTELPPKVRSSEPCAPTLVLRTFPVPTKTPPMPAALATPPVGVPTASDAVPTLIVLVKRKPVAASPADPLAASDGGDDHGTVVMSYVMT